jgi:hypothetical protein
VQSENKKEQGLSKKAIKSFNTKNLQKLLTKMSSSSRETVLKKLRDILKKLFEEHGISFEN